VNGFEEAREISEKVDFRSLFVALKDTRSMAES
jgi:hypothetical protein